jgi:NAD(P)-dependent dehydrogenase (short-subunit alcohol dehydrogenase family)
MGLEMPKKDNQPLALVTGGATRIGRAIALGLAHEGFAIGLHYHRSAVDAIKTAGEIEKLGIPVFPMCADLSDVNQLYGLFDKVATAPYTLKVLVNSAAVMRPSDILKADIEEWESILSINLRAPWLCMQKASTIMGPGSSIINVTDAASGKAWKTYSIYGLSKSSLEHLTRMMAGSLAPHIRVNCVAPGLILPPDHVTTNHWERMVKKIPARQPGKTEHIVHAILFLINNTYITGQTLVVDGGFQLT